MRSNYIYDSRQRCSSMLKNPLRKRKPCEGGCRLQGFCILLNTILVFCVIVATLAGVVLSNFDLPGQARVLGGSETFGVRQ